MRTPLVLLPPSKGKAPGGDGPSLRDQLAQDGPLAAPRRAVLEAAVAAAADLDDRSLARLTGVAVGDVSVQRDRLAGLADAPTMPAHRRYTGVVHGNAGLGSVDPSRVRADVRIVSPLLGVVALEEPTPDYRLELAARLPSLGGLGPYWRERLTDHLVELTADRRVWDLLPGEHAVIWSSQLRDRQRVTVRFVRPDGRAANAARTKVAKGRLAAALLRAPSMTPARAARDVDLGDGWELEASGRELTATYRG